MRLRPLLLHYPSSPVQLPSTQGAEGQFAWQCTETPPVCHRPLLSPYDFAITAYDGGRCSYQDHVSERPTWRGFPITAHLAMPTGRIFQATGLPLSRYGLR